MVIDKYTEKVRIKEVIKLLANSSGDPLNWIHLLDECVLDLLEDVHWVVEKEK